MSFTEPQVLKGDVFTDSRGTLRFNNELDLSNIKRFYLVSNEPGIIRAWQAHRYESKIFVPLKGKFKVCLVKIDNWDSPSEELKPLVYTLSAENSDSLVIPGGYANGFTSDSPSSELMVFSSASLSESKNDDYRFKPELWYNWNKKEIK